MDRIRHTSVRATLLGYGAIAAMHVRALRAAGAHIEVVAGPDRSAVRAFAAAHDIPRSTTDPIEAIEQHDVECVVVASPTHAHVDQVGRALDSGRHVLAEIPLATSLADGDHLVSLAERAGRALMVAHTRRYQASMRRLRAEMARHDLRPSHVIARVVSLRQEDVGWTGRRRTWTDDLLWHHGGHAVDAVLGLLGAPVTDITSLSGPRWARSGRSMDHSIGLRTEDGRVATIALSYHARITASEILVIGEQTTVVLDGGTTHWAGELPVTSDDRLDVAIAAQDADFVAAVRRGVVRDDGQWTDSDGRSVLPTLLVLQAVDDRARADLPGDRIAAG